MSDVPGQVTRNLEHSQFVAMEAILGVGQQVQAEKNLSMMIFLTNYYFGIG
jgi:hypothetical protein